MRLRVRVLTAGVCTTVAILFLVCLVMRAIVLRSFADLESRQVRQHVERAQAALDQRLARLAVSTEDWGAWDDTYAFIQDHNTAYVDSNLGVEALASLQIDALALVDASGAAVRVVERPREGHPEGLGPALLAALWDDGRLASRLGRQPVTGTLAIRQELVLVATHPIMMSDLSGPPRGTLLMAQRLDDHHVSLLSDVARLPITIERLDAGDAPAGSLHPVDALIQGDGTSVHVVDSRTISGRGLLRDVWGQPVAVMEISLPRDVYSRGISTAAIFFLSLALGTILPIGAAMLVLHRQVTGPVEDLSSLVDRVRRSGDLDARLTPQGSAEVVSLAESVNGMLAAIQESERERRQADERYRLLIENLRDVIYTLDLKGIVTYVSPAISAVVGLTPNEVIGRRVAELVHPGDRESVRQLVNRAASGGNDNAQCRLVSSQGDVRWVWLSVRPNAVDGRVVGVQGILTDVTGRHELELQLRQAQKMEAIGQLAEGMAHDFNNLLTVINGYAATTLQAMDADNPLREDIARIHHAGERGAALTRRLLTLGRQRLGSPRVIALGEVLVQTTDTMRRLTNGTITVALDLPEDELYVQAEPGQIEQVIMNLAINARDAMPDGGKLTIRARIEPAAAGGDPAEAQAPSVVLTVEDTGSGMTPEIMEHAFEPFFTTKEAGKGTGLGLATVYGIVHQNRGTVALGSAPGEGTTVTIRLPAEPAPPAPARQAESEPAAKPRGSERVLVVEDQREVRQLAQRMLQHMGYQVEAAANPTEVLARYDPGERPFDVVLSDVAMPNLSGPEFVARLRERGRGCDSRFAVVYMSGYAEESVLRRNVLRPGEQFLQKPFTVEQLASVIRSALDRSPCSARQPVAAA